MKTDRRRKAPVQGVCRMCRQCAGCVQASALYLRARFQSSTGAARRAAKACRMCRIYPPLLRKKDEDKRRKKREKRGVPGVVCLHILHILHAFG